MIAPTSAADAGLLAAIHATSFAEPWDEAAMAALLMRPGTIGWRSAECAMLLVQIAADQAEILTLAVRPANRNQGLARQLLDTGCAELRAAGVIVVHLEVAAGNHAALALYRAAGFEAVAVRRAYYRDRSDAIAMTLRLSGN